MPGHFAAMQKKHAGTVHLNNTTPHHTTHHTLIKMGHVQSHSIAMRLFESHEATATESVEERREDDVDSNVDSTELPREMPRHATVPI